MTKLCKRCSTEKDESKFYRMKRAKDGLQAYCKPCMNLALGKYAGQYGKYYEAIPRRPCVYFVGPSPLGSGPIKIGVTDKIILRLSALRSSSPIPLELHGIVHFEDYRAAKASEKMLHEMFATDNSHGEWFNASPQLVRFVQETSVTDWPVSS